MPGSYKPEQQYEVGLREAALGKDHISLFPFSTTGEIIITAEYHDYALNPFNENGWSYVSVAHPPEKNAKEKTSTTNVDDADTFIIRKSWNNFNEKTDNDKLDTILTDDLNPGLVKEMFNLFRHQFPDTRFRKVKYTLEAVSKFAEFFDIKAHGVDKTDNKPFSLIATLDTVEDSNEWYTIIKNSSKPRKPQITSIVPVFTIEEKADSYKFRHREYRVYLGNNWFETGLDEKLAVVYKLQNPLEEDAVFKNKITVIANDPTTENRNVYDTTSNTYIDSPRVPPDMVNLRIINATIDSLKNASPVVAAGETNPNYHPDQHVDGFSSFDVKWCKMKREFYADVLLKDGALDHYSSLIKLAICRYQQHSIVNPGFYDYRFSDVVMTDMLPVLAKRTLTIDTEQNCIVFDVHGQHGGRYNKDKILRPNELYLISEKSGIDENVTRIAEEGQIHITRLQVINKEALKSVLATKEGGAIIDRDSYQKGFKSKFIEEYEHISIDDKFEMDENTAARYNPRNDPRKRLVFFYKLK